MKLFEHPDFEQAVVQCADHFRERGLREAIIEKDYYVVEALRILQNAAGSHLIFKGGTSLSKGWGLIERFSEDVDIFLDPEAFDPMLGKRGIDRRLKELKEIVERHPGLSFLRAESQTIGGFGRNDRFEYRQLFGGPGELRNQVFLEIGTASGREPTAQVEISSYLSQFLSETGVSLGTEDERPFEMRLLHFRRTFVEKMFAIHAKVEAYRESGVPIGGYARHYYDLYCLASQSDVREMLDSDEYAAIKADYDRISRTHFSRSYVAPPKMSFALSEALYPSAELAGALSAEYESQCRVLCFGRFPEWRELREEFDSIRQLL